MFLGDRKNIIQSFILSDDETVKQQALADLLKVQTEDFLAMFKTMSGRDVVVRLLDPPLHEFLDNPRELEVAITKKEAAGASEEELAVLRTRLRRIDGMVESNPMLGLRGVRLSVVFSDLPLMQVKAIVEAACCPPHQGGRRSASRDHGAARIHHGPSMSRPARSIERVIAEVSAEEGVELNIPVGTMLELPRACMVADEIAGAADFFSFGTNDLTQTTFGFSRDDAEAKFIPLYMHKKILKDNPFETIDTAVLELVRMAVEKGRATNPDMHFGVCGEHGGDRTASSSSTRPTWTTCPAHPSGCRSPAGRRALGTRDRGGGKQRLTCSRPGPAPVRPRPTAAGSWPAPWRRASG